MAAETVKSVTPRTRAAWRKWLEAHHASEREVWLVFYKRHTQKSSLSYADAVEEALCFGWIDGVKRSIDAERYMHRFTPRKPGSRWSATNRARVERLDKAGSMAPAGRKAVRDAKRSGKWAEPAASVDLSVPPELATRLARNRKAAVFFESLAPSYRQQFAAWINVAKRAETRQKRIDEAVELLARGEKLGMR